MVEARINKIVEVTLVGLLSWAMVLGVGFWIIVCEAYKWIGRIDNKDD